MEHKYWAYIVASLSGTLYIGMTNWRLTPLRMTVV